MANHQKLDWFYIIIFLAIILTLISIGIIVFKLKNAPGPICSKNGQECDQKANCCSGLICRENICQLEEAGGDLKTNSYSNSRDITACPYENKECGPGPCGDQSTYLFFCPAGTRCQIDPCSPKRRNCLKDNACQTVSTSTVAPNPEKCSFKTKADCGGSCGKTVCKASEKCLYNTCDEANGICAVNPSCK